MADMAENKVKVSGIEYVAGDSPDCPQCGRRFFCRDHKYMYEKWYKNWRKRPYSFGCG